MSTAVMKRDFVGEFKASFNLVEASLGRCAEIYVAALDESPEWKPKFIAEMADVVPRLFWNELEAVGRKWKHPKLLLGGAGANAPLVKLLPYSDQERIFTDKVEMLTPSGQVLRVDIKTVAPAQAEQLIDRKARALRDLPAQRAYVEALKLPANKGDEAEAEIMPYTISGGKVTFRRGVVLGRRELVRIIKELA
jgi:hypothetical protein